MTTPPLRADLVLRSATVLTMDPADTRARAVAVRGGIIVGVGADHDVESLIGPGTRVIDGRGKTVTPGFIDSHTHNVFVGEFRYRLDQLNLPAQLTPTVEALLAQVKERAARTPAGTWIGGKNVEPNGMQERRWPTRHELDRVAPHHPVVLTIRGGHACVANTRALDLFGIGQGTPDPEGGVIDRDPATGDLTGVLRDVTTIRSALPQATVGELKDGLATLEKMFLRLGITSTHDCGAGARPEPYRAYGEAAAERRWRIRTSFFVYHDFLMANEELFREGFDDQLKLRGVKLFMDGSIQCFTCAFREPYVTRDTRGWEGLRYSQDKVDESVMEAHRRGYQVAIHAQGDYGITMAVNAIERAMEAVPRPDPRHRIEHTLCPTLDDLQRMQRLGITPNFFLFHPWFWGDQHLNEFIGPARAWHGAGAHGHRSRHAPLRPLGLPGVHPGRSGVALQSPLGHGLRGDTADAVRGRHRRGRARHPPRGDSHLHRQRRPRRLRGRGERLCRSGQAGRPGDARRESPRGGSVGHQGHHGGANHTRRRDRIRPRT
jgi:predicted amidohydrolase YtcJ